MGHAMSLGAHISRPEVGSATDPRQTLAYRELFWHNVLREMLMSLSVMATTRESEPYDPAMEAAMRETFDGRLAIITTTGIRIAIAEVHPLFACSVPVSKAQRHLSARVQCTVFQIRTPNGEVHTVPLHEIRGFHALTDELMQHLSQMSQAQEGAGRGRGRAVRVRGVHVDGAGRRG